MRTLTSGLVSIAAWIILILAGLLLWALFSRWVLDNPRGEVAIGLAYRAVQVYSRWFHGLRVEGRENIPRGNHVGPLVVVCNHTAGVDPLLVQAACEFEVRWMMATDMRLARYEWFWRWAGVISVNRKGRDSVGARQAVRHLEEGGVLGVFPEGAIERPPRTILPFFAGVGLIIARTGAPVLPVIIDGTPQVNPAWASLWKTSNSVVTFGEPLSFVGRDLSPAEIADELREWFVVKTGWGRAEGE